MFTGCCVARIRVIFRLPQHLWPLTCPLAYVHWYRPLTTLDAATSMYKIAPSTHRNAPNSEIIRVDQIWQGCILTPHFGSGSVPVSWHSENVLDTTQTFYLGKYINSHIFEAYEKSKRIQT